MPYRVEFTTRATRDLNHLFERIKAADSVQAAQWLNGLEAAILTLERLPHRCPAAPEGKVAKRALRHLLYGKKPHVYRVVYQIDEPSHSVWVLTIRHGARDAVSLSRAHRSVS
jgi:toxin ParE1/3/4